MEHHLELQSEAEHAHLLLQQWLKGSRCIDMKRGSTSQQTECRNHSYEPKAMVAMQMGNEHGTDLRKTDVRTAQQHLCALTTIDKEELAANLDNLC